ncbi:MAG: aldehyde dehydrogenase family protein [Planctomycetota bacterium]
MGSPERNLPSPEDARGLAAAEVAAARECSRAWGAEPVAGRIALLRRLRRLLAEEPFRLALRARGGDAEAARESLVGEVLPLLDACRFLERRAKRLLAPRRAGFRGRPLWLRGVRLEIRRDPHGVVLVIGPYNYPLFLPGAQALQALAAGNAVVLKPGAGGSAAAEALRDALLRAGADGRLLQVLPEDPAYAAAAIEAGVDKVVLTGSARTGVQVLSELAPAIVPATAELSGCDAVYVLESADLDRAVRALAFGLRWNGSETCIAPRRVFAFAGIAGSLESALAEAARAIRPRPCRPAAADLLRELLLEAEAEGARIVAGSPASVSAESCAPVVVAGARPEMRLLKADIFAPVVSIVRVAGAAEALAASEKCPYALGASVFGEEREALELARWVPAGAVVVNDAIVPTADPRFPFGGRGRSGYGVTRGAEGLLEMTRVRAIAVRRGRSGRHLEELRPGDQALFEDFIRMVHGGGWRERFAAARSLAGAFRRRGSPP